ncbi:hypothetical protein MRX96_033692 [Rhipicephalus microplus]
MVVHRPDFLANLSMLQTARRRAGYPGFPGGRPREKKHRSFSTPLQSARSIVSELQSSSAGKRNTTTRVNAPCRQLFPFPRRHTEFHDVSLSASRLDASFHTTSPPARSVRRRGVSDGLDALDVSERRFCEKRGGSTRVGARRNRDAVSGHPSSSYREKAREQLRHISEDAAEENGARPLTFDEFPWGVIP